MISDVGKFEEDSMLRVIFHSVTLTQVAQLSNPIRFAKNVNHHLGLSGNLALSFFHCVRQRKHMVLAIQIRQVVVLRSSLPEYGVC